MRFLLLLPADHWCESPAAVRPLAFGPVGFFLPGLAGLESLTKRMEAAAARVNLRVAA